VLIFITFLVIKFDDFSSLYRLRRVLSIENHICSICRQQRSVLHQGDGFYASLARRDLHEAPLPIIIQHVHFLGFRLLVVAAQFTCISVEKFVQIFPILGGAMPANA